MYIIFSNLYLKEHISFILDFYQEKSQFGESKPISSPAALSLLKDIPLHGFLKVNFNYSVWQCCVVESLNFKMVQW